MSNVWYAVDAQGQRVAEFLSRDYGSTALVERHGHGLRLFDKSDGDRPLGPVRSWWEPNPEQLR